MSRRCTQFCCIHPLNKWRELQDVFITVSLRSSPNASSRIKEFSIHESRTLCSLIGDIRGLDLWKLLPCKLVKFPGLIFREKWTAKFCCFFVIFYSTQNFRREPVYVSSEWKRALTARISVGSDPMFQVEINGLLSMLAAQHWPRSEQAAEEDPD